MVREVESYTIFENYNIEKGGVLCFFLEHNINFEVSGSYARNNVIQAIFTAFLLEEDALVLRIKFPEILIKKISIE